MTKIAAGKVGIVMPTYNVGITINKLIPSIEYITELKGIATWLINFNGDQWTARWVDKAVSRIMSYGFPVRFIRSGIWEKPINIIKMREQCAKLYPECDIYLFIDDDFEFVKETPAYKFTSGQRYLQTIDYMTRFPNCGVVNTKSFLGGSPFKLKIVPTRDAMYATNRGLFLRNMIEHGFLLAPKKTHNLVGGLEETMMVFERIRRGYFCACQYNNPTIHITGKLEDYDDDYDDFHNIQLINNNIGSYLRNEFNDWSWKYSEKKFPQKLWNEYSQNGGLPIEYKDQKYTIDYALIGS